MQLTLVVSVLMLAAVCVGASSEQASFQTIVREIRGVNHSQQQQQQLQQQEQQVFNGTQKFQEIKQHLLAVLRSPNWRDEFYRLIRDINARMNVTENATIPSSTSRPATISERRLGGCCNYRLFQRNGTSRYVYRSVDTAKNGRARRIAARLRRGKTRKCPKFYQEAYCLYGECEITPNFNVLLCQCPRNALGDHCELKKLDQCFDHSGRRVVEQLRDSSLYSAARQPEQVVMQHATWNSRMSMRKQEEVRCSPQVCRNRGTCTEVPGVTFHCECFEGYGEKNCTSFMAYIFLRELWDAEENKRIAQDEDVQLTETEQRLLEGFADSVCAGRWDGRCREQDAFEFEELLN